MIKKIVVYILLFSFLLLDFPQGVLANVPDAQLPPPTPPPGGYVWQYVFNNATGKTDLRFFYQSGAKYVDLLNKDNGVALSDIYAALGTINFGDSSWSIWSAGSLSEKFYILAYKDAVYNVCFPKDDTAASSTFSKSDVPTIYTAMPSTDYACFNSLEKDGNGIVASRPSFNDFASANMPSLITHNADGTDTDYNPAFRAILQYGRTIGNKIAPYTLPKPTDEHDKACKDFYAKKQITTADDAKKWIANEITHLLSLDKDQNHVAINAVQTALKDSGTSNKLNQDLIKEDADALKQFYGEVDKRPTIPITNAQYQSILSKYQEAQAALTANNTMKYFQTYLDFSLMKYYALVNLAYNKCLKEKGDGAALYDATIESSINTLEKDLGTGMGDVTGKDKETGCPDLSFSGKFSFSRTINVVVCTIFYTLYQIIGWVVDQSAKIAQSAAGYDQ